MEIILCLNFSIVFPESVARGNRIELKSAPSKKGLFKSEGKKQSQCQCAE